MRALDFVPAQATADQPDGINALAGILNDADPDGLEGSVQGWPPTGEVQEPPDRLADAGNDTGLARNADATSGSDAGEDTISPNASADEPHGAQLAQAAPATTGRDAISATGADASVEYTNRDGTKTVYERGDRAWRTRNPGAIQYGDFARDHGAIGVHTVAPFSDGTKLPDLAIFPDVETGRRAQRALLKGQKYQELTIDGVIERYSKTDRERYKEFVREALKLPGTTPMRDLTPEQFDQFLKTIQRFERSLPGTVREIPAPGR
jgi:hypothetical protein